MKKVEAFQCDFCSYTNIKKQNARVHERRCCKNPLNKACATCEYFERAEREYDVYLGDGVVDQRTTSGRWCEHERSWLNDLKKNCKDWSGKYEKEAG